VFKSIFFSCGKLTFSFDIEYHFFTLSHQPLRNDYLGQIVKKLVVL